jgi:hypothetical protein
MNTFSRACLFLLAALTTATDVDTKKSMRTRILGGSGTFHVPEIKGGTKGLRGTTPSGSYITVKSKGASSPSTNVTALVRSIAPKSMGGAMKKKKVDSRTIRTIPKGLFGGTSRSGGAIGGFPDCGDVGDNTEEKCDAQLSLSFEADRFSNSENAMVLFDLATYDSATGNLNEDPIWNYDIGDLTNERAYNLEECLDENACYVFMFVGEF